MHFMTKFGLLGRRRTVSANELNPLNPQGWKMAAPGAGVIVCQLLGLREIRFLASLRAKSVGEGHGITGGGFVECNKLYKEPVGTIAQTADEAHREAREENADFDKVISVDEFLKRAQPIALFNVRTSDLNGVHAVTMYSLCVKDDAEWERFVLLEPGVDESGKIERIGPLLEYTMRWTSDISLREPEKAVTFTGVDGEQLPFDCFFHAHEVRAIASIAWHAENERLWL
jgi:hypothetical protein